LWINQAEKRSDVSIKLYNTLNNRKEEFVPVEQGRIKFYVCGPTVYDYIHIGNARAFIVFDVWRKFFQHMGYDVTYVMNLTDIDDRIIERAIRDGRDYREIAETYAQAFFEDLRGLGVAPADHHPKATEHIEEIIALIGTLVQQGLAYQVNGDVFYDVSKFADYGKLSGKKTEDLQSGARVAVDESKRNPLDFALWKSKKPGEPAWESPWGEGRPGWHIECSAMSMKYLGSSFDIHAGGVDLIFPHHENEIAQSEGATETSFVKYWLHNGFLKIDGEKMAKSLGNFRTVREILKTYSGAVLRMFFLQKHYRSPIDFTHEGLSAAESAVARLGAFYNKLNACADPVSPEEADAQLDLSALSEEEKRAWQFWLQAKADLIAAMEDDLNTPLALSRLFEMVRELNKVLSGDDFSPACRMLFGRAKRDFDALNGVFGILGVEESGADTGLVDDLMTLLIDIRKELRAKKEWQLADEIRDRLSDSGILLEDSKSGTSWRRK